MNMPSDDDSFGKPPRLPPNGPEEPAPTIDLPSREVDDTGDADIPPTIARTIGSDTVPSQREATHFRSMKFGHYTLLEEIARGGMGVVFKARDENLNRVVALKMILSGRFASSDDVRRFYQEAESAANLDHPGIVPIYEVGEFEGNHFFTMKLMEYGSLVPWLPTLQSQPRKSAKLMAKVARAIHYAHQRGILHRDIKPANILIDADANPLVSDLGLAKDMTAESDLTHTGAVVGTPGYMPPEQAAGSKEITTAADIYGIGAILYELLTGHRPHRGETVIETLRKVIDDEPATPRSIDKKIDRTLELICLKCLAKNPDDRYTSAGALADDLENWLEGKPVQARPPSVGSMFESALKQTLRSAGGAALVGLVAGLFLSAIFWATHIAPTLVSVGEVYDRMPSETRPMIWGLEHAEEWKGVGLCVLVLVLILIGWINTAIVRPKPGAQAFAIGMVAGLVMTLALYCLGTGYGSLAHVTHAPLHDDVELLTQGTVGTDEQRAYAKRMFEWKYPDLANIEEERRADTLEDKFLGDAFLSIPLGLVIGMIATLFTCVVTSVGGTMFASHLLDVKKRLRWTVFPYLEVMTLVAVAIGWFSLVQWQQSVGYAEGNPSIWLQLLLVAALLVTAFVAARRWSIPCRTLSHLTWVIALMIYLWASTQISIGYGLAGYHARNGDWESATRYIERRTSAAPKWPHGHMLAGSCQALTGNKEAYREHCKYVLDHYRRTTDPERADLAGKLCMLRPDWLDDATPGIELGKFAEEEGKENKFYEWFVLTRALAAYREGDLDGVDEWTEKCQASDKNHYILATADVIRAMALVDRDRREEAEQEIAKALELMSAEEWDTKSWWENIIIFETLLKEAREKLAA